MTEITKETKALPRSKKLQLMETSSKMFRKRSAP